MKRLLIIARDFNSAQHYAKDLKMSPGQWVYVSSYHNIKGNPESDYVKIKGWDMRPDISVLEEALHESNCTEVMHQVYRKYVFR